LNERFSATFGYTLDDVPNLKVWWQRAYPDEEYRKEVISTWQRAVEEAGASTGDIKPHEYQVTCEDGTIRTVEIFGSKIRNKILVLLADITERKKREEEKEQLLKQVQTSRQRLQKLSQQLVEVQEGERRDLVRKLHDEVGQDLTALSLNLNIIHSQLSAETKARIATRVDDSLNLVEKTVERIRDLMAELRPPVLDDYGLTAALNWYGKQFSQRTGIKCILQLKELSPRLSLSKEMTLFRIAQEALTNVAKHARAKRVTLGLKEIHGEIHLTIADNGIGFDPQKHRPGAKPEWGLINIRERVEAAGGRLRVETAPGKGTKISLGIKR
jgi:two-component system sensor histidine kinase UhpB